ncbi:MAG: tRNA (adenosine(37)-N6)-threonylcarbamoyltransferase complex dimerization subunit type 1 TsaB [Chrysiogenales bacterium]
MNLLSLDTSSRDASITVLKNEDILLEYNFTSQDNLSAMLVPSLEFILKALGMQMAHIDAFGIGIGPGNFTGIRIGMATLKGLAFAERKPVVGVISLKALAYKFVDTKKTVISLIDAKKGEVYLGGYQFSNGELVALIPPCLIKITDIVPLVVKFPEKIFVGSGAEKHLEFLKNNFSDSCRLYRSNFLANEIGRIALQQFRCQQYLTDLQDLLPFYINKPDAETNFNNSAGADN